MASEEILNQVDEHDQVIGQVSLAEANSNPNIWHREVAGLLFDQDDRVLLQQRSLRKRLEPGKWTVTFAGHIPVPKTELEGAHMELSEELGFDTELVLVKKFASRIPTESRFFYYYLGRYRDQPIRLQESEVAQAKLFSAEEYGRELRGTDVVVGLTTELLDEFWSGKLDRFKRKLS